MALVLNSDLGNGVADKDKYTEKRLIIKVSLTEVMFIRRKVSFRWNGPSDTKGAARSHCEARVQARHGRGTHASVDRIKTGDIQFSFPAEKLISTFACVCQPKLFLQVFCQFRLHLP